MIRFVFFDYDGVLTTDRTGSLTTCRHLAAAAGLPLERVRAAFAPHNHALTLGRMTHEEAWPRICAELGAALPLQLLQDAFDSTPANAPMFALARRLRAAGCGAGIITDNKSDRIRRLRAVQDLDALFDPIVVSADLGCSKESEAIFRHALENAGADAGECVFIDNDAGNAARATALGLHGIHFDDALNDVPALAAALARDFGLPA
ncbi:HAD-IA family hydrolase [Ramlibacter sp. G-1-2-2]|uniref:HAD-IA family hydrolase n=1 Tax=Ramlibacter agri TaxID=2728837 RepID=A0A848H2S6_9BURK|nr:HAD-IA family hydrolase [Ramlibacter agri]NML44777.1 HAD-IA family hydrolase [Ramlibacter agri]